MVDDPTEATIRRMPHVSPAHLSQQSGSDPRTQALDWFRQARYGLFLHFGPYSLLGRHEWVQYQERIPVADYARLAEGFTAERFDADAIAALAVEAGMRYINLTTRHHDSYCLFASAATSFSCAGGPARRDLVGELAAACARRGLGLFLYYSHGRDWRHPHAPHNEGWGGCARPEYDPPEPAYATGAGHRLERYVEFLSTQVAELLDNYGPIAGIWLDGIATPLHRRGSSPCPLPPRQPGNCPEWRVQELYDLIHARQPHALVAYKQGLLGTEDYLAPEHQAIPAAAGKPMEICTTLCPDSWGWLKAGQGRHLGPDQVWERLREVSGRGCNLLLNTGLLPDGSLDPEDVAPLRRVGERLHREGFPDGEGGAPAPGGEAASAPGERW